MFQSDISPEEVNALPIGRYEGEVRLVETARDLEHAMADLFDEGVVGFDTETRPAFRVGQSYPPALAQAATAKAVYLFQLRESHAYPAIKELLSSGKTMKAGVGLADDLRALRKVMEFEEQGLVDLSAVARRHGLKKSGVRTLAALFLGFRVPKGAKTTNWAAPRLSAQQIAYAATDAWVCRELYLRFHGLGLLDTNTQQKAAPPK
jgi:ribonuclease D